MPITNQAKLGFDTSNIGVLLVCNSIVYEYKISRIEP